MTERWTPKQWQEYQQKQNRARNSKFGGIPTQTSDGRKFDSHVEAAYYNRCLILKQAGEILHIELKVMYELTVNGYFICNYELDFRVTYADGRIEYVDTKSKETLTPLYKMKKALMKAIHGIDLIEVYWEDFKQ